MGAYEKTNEELIQELVKIQKEKQELENIIHGWNDEPLSVEKLANIAINDEKPKILIVDDLAVNLNLLEDLLGDLEVDFVRANSGNEALEKILEHEFAIALIDIQMPEMDGFETVEYMRKHKRSRFLPVIFISAIYYENYYHIKGIKTGAVDFITKPIIPEILIGKVKVFIDLYKQKKRIEQTNRILLRTIEERNKIKQKLEEQNQFLNTVIESLTYPFYVVNTKDFTVKLANTAAGKYTQGISLCHKLSHNENYPCSVCGYQCPMEKVMETKTPLVVEHAIKDANNEERNYEVHCYPIINKHGQVTEVIEYLNDITKRKEAEKKLAQYQNHLEELVQERTHDLRIAKEKAEESDRLKTAFLTNVSHELRTPMNAILGFSNLLATPKVAEEQKAKFARHIEENGNTLLNLIDDILDIAKIEAGEIKIHKENTQINVILDELYSNFFEEKNRNKKDEIEFILKKEINSASFSIYTDGNRVKQVLSKLLSNALKFTEKGLVEFGYKIEAHNNLKFYVKDSGIGIDKENQKTIFERFRKVESEKAKKLYRGAGLGLSISKKIIELLGGNMWVESIPNEGAIFHFNVPCTPSSRMQITGSSFRCKWSSKKILIVEDNDNDFLFIEEVLQQTHISITRALDGEEAVELIKEKSDFDIILMDIQMPKMNGFVAVVEIKKIKKDIKIIAQTAYVLAREKDRILSFGFNDFIDKSMNSDEILSIISKYI